MSAVKALPRRPNPNAAEKEPAPRMNTTHDEGNGDDKDDGPDLGEPDVEDRLGGPREMRLTSKLFAKYGHSKGCFGCAHKQAGLPDHRQRSAGCRRRIRSE